ncbi:VMAP-C domain-containing protein [Streptomyces sp. NPDC004685]
MTAAAPSRADLYWELAHRLAKVHGVSDAAPRARALRAVEELFGPVEAARSSMLIEDLAEALRACDERPGGLRAYLDEIGRGRTSTVAWGSVEEIHRLLHPERLLSPDDHDTLAGLLKQCATGESLRSLALRILPFVPDPDTYGDARADPVDVLLTAFEDVAVMEDEPHPLLVFVEAVAVREEGATARQLTVWNRRVARRLGCTLDRLKSVRAAEAAYAGRPFEPGRLLVEIVSHPAVPDAFHIRGWLLAPGEGPRALLGDRQVTSLRHLEETVATLHQRTLEQLGELSAGLRVEFLLPRPLLWLAVDQIMVRPSGSVARPLGADHTVLVRSRDRIRNRHWWPALHRRLDWLELHPEGRIDEGAVQCVPHGGKLSPAVLVAQLRHTATPVCFVLLEPPQYTGDMADDPVTALLEAGIPAIVAVRGNGDHENARLEVWKVLDGRLDTLPERVRVLRGGVGPAGGALSTLDLHRHVTLVWDSRDGLEGAEAVLGHPRTGGGIP